MKVHGEEKLLPGIDLSHDQLFFLNFAQVTNQRLDGRVALADRASNWRVVSDMVWEGSTRASRQLDQSECTQPGEIQVSFPCNDLDS